MGESVRNRRKAAGAVDSGIKIPISWHDNTSPMGSGVSSTGHDTRIPEKTDLFRHSLDSVVMSDVYLYYLSNSLDGSWMRLMGLAHRRHDMSDRVWLLLEPHLLGRAGSWGGVAQDNRRFINAIFWILRTGAPWRDLPPDYGDWKNTHRRFCRWRDKGL